MKIQLISLLSLVYSSEQISVHPVVDRIKKAERTSLHCAQGIANESKYAFEKNRAPKKIKKRDRFLPYNNH